MPSSSDGGRRWHVDAMMDPGPDMPRWVIAFERLASPVV
jgi:hypothetical protein